jgi:FkbM family methyltransferase
LFDLCEHHLSDHFGTGMKSLKLFLIGILDFFRHKKSYAQDGEDVALAAFFEGKKGYKGFFVDVGAHHPVRFSNTWMFYKKGWRGINIDPTPGSMRSFGWLRPRDLNLEIGIAGESSTMPFFCFNEPALNTFDASVAQQRNTGQPYRVIKTVDVPIMPLSGVFEQHLLSGQEIDFMSVDVEGLDLQVLKSNNWDQYRPKYLLVEDVHFDPNEPQKSEVCLYLKGLTYHIVAVLKRTIIFESQI